jgi:PAS domain-containing protein
MPATRDKFEPIAIEWSESASKLLAAVEKLPDLLKAEYRLATATELLRGWVWETDAGHRFTFVGESVREFGRRAPDWHYGKTREQVGDHPAEAADGEQFARLLAVRQAFGPIVFRRRQDEGWLWMRVAGKPIFDAAGAFIGYRGIAFDTAIDTPKDPDPA